MGRAVWVIGGVLLWAGVGFAAFSLESPSKCRKQLDTKLPTTRQIRRVLSAVRSSFRELRGSSDVLPKGWAEKNLASPVASTGFCFAATNALYHLLGGKRAGLVPMVARYREGDEEVSHWWLRDSEGHYWDPTEDQYTALGKTPPYHSGKGAGFNRPLEIPTKAGSRIMEIAARALAKKGFTSNGELCAEREPCSR